jgi:hypothetical protein
MVQTICEGGDRSTGVQAVVRDSESETLWVSFRQLAALEALDPAIRSSSKMNMQAIFCFNPP